MTTGLNLEKMTVMRKTIKLFLPVCIALSAAAACNKEFSDQPQSGSYIIKASAGDLSKAVIADGESIKWAKGDVVVLAAKEGNSSSCTVEEDNLSELSWTAENLTQGTDFVLLKTNHDARAFANTEIRFLAEQVQSEAGVLNSENIVLQSDVTQVPVLAEGETGVTIPVSMKIIGSLYRFIPYTESYNGESIQYVSFLSADKNITGGGAVIGKDYNTPELYRQADRSMGSECVIFWDAVSKEVKTVLSAPMALDGVTSAASSKGIYMSLAPISMEGYKYVVKTDAATYTFDASDKALQIQENELKNVFLNLDKAVRVADSDVRGELRYEPGYAQNFELSGYASRTDLFYRYAQIEGKVIENQAGNEAYYDVDIEVTNEDGSECGWLDVAYGEHSTHIFATTLSDNESGSNRVANVTIKYPVSVDGYYTREQDLTVKFTVAQKPASTREITFWGGLGAEYEKDAHAYTGEGLSYWVVQVDGANATDWSGDSHNEQAIYGGAVFKMIDFDSYQTKGINGDEITWAKAYYKNEGPKVIDTWWLVDIEENDSAAERKCVIVCTFPAISGYSYKDSQNIRTTVLKQKGNTVVEASISNVYQGLIPAAGGEIEAGVLTLTVNGSVAADAAAAISAYGVSVSANKGASCTVSADGKIMLTVPENSYKNGGVEYTITVRWDGKTIATATVMQDEGKEENTQKTYSYKIYKRAGNESGTGFGLPANMEGKGNYVQIEEITLDGAAVDLTDASVIEEIMEQAVKFINDESYAFYPGGYLFATREEITYSANVAGNSIMIDFRTVNANGKKTCFVWYNADGSEAGRWYLWA